MLLFGGTCVVLTVVSLLLTRSGSPYSGSINGAISIAAIAATTYLVLKIESAQAATYAARAQLAHIARVTTLGELTASIAHEVNQPLTAVVTNGNAGLRWLAAAPPNIAEAKQVIGRIVNEAKRASEIIGRVRHLARRAPAAPDWFDINETVLATIPPVQNQLKADRILLQTELGTDCPPFIAIRSSCSKSCLICWSTRSSRWQRSDTNAENCGWRRAEAGAVSWWRYEIPVLAWVRSLTRCSTLSTRQSLTGLEWGSQ